MFGRLAFALSLAACGRLGFGAREATDDAASDGAAGDVASDASCTLGPWGPVVEETVLNRGANNDYGGQLAPSGLAIVFDSDNVSSHDLFWSERPSRTAAWSQPTELVELNNTMAAESDATLTGDLLELYFASTRDGDYCIFRSERSTVAAKWGPPVRQVTLCPTGASAGPWIAPDGLRIYYNSRDDGQGEGRVFVAERASRTDPFGPSTQVLFGGLAYNRGYPVLADGERTIYFEYGSPLRIARATRAAVGDAFGIPEDVAETNASQGENADISLTEDGQLLVWSSTRNGGQYDLFSLSRSCQ